MTADDQQLSLADDLAARSDEQLVELLTLRPDLASPPPGGTGVLAQRALASGSINLAGDDLDLLAVAVLETILEKPIDAGHGGTRATSSDAIVAALDGRADQDDILARIEALHARALLWGPRTALRCGAHVGSALPWRAHHLVGPLSSLSLIDIRHALDGLDERARDLLMTLAAGSPLGRTRDAAAEADSTRPVPTLISAGLLARVDEQTVELPPVVGAVLRGEAVREPADLREPPLTTPTARSRFGASGVQAAAGGEALELIRHAGLVIDELSIRPAAVLRAGGLGVREMRRIAKNTGIDVARVGLMLETLSGDRLIDTGYPDPPPADGNDELCWAPTPSVESWPHHPPERRWLGLARAWLALPRRPWQIGEKSREGTTLAALSGDLHDAAAAQERRLVLETLAIAKPDVSVDVNALIAVLTWRHPRWARRLTVGAVSAILAEARALGLIAHGALTPPGRALLAEGSPDDVADAALTAMRSALPEPIDHFLTQADLTVTAPGPIIPDLATELALTAELESAGAASVYRVTEASVRRALDAGRSTSELISLFTTHSRTPVPQSLKYLITDVGRRHGQLRVGMAGSFIRCEDPTILASVMSSPVAQDLSLRALAPTVAVTPAGIREVLDGLRIAGFAPAGEDSSGTVVDIAIRGSRVPLTRKVRTASPGRPRPATAEQLASVVARVRSHDTAHSALPPSSAGPVRATGSGQSISVLLALAVRTGRQVRVDYVDAQGSATKHLVLAKAVGAGQLVAADPRTSDELRFPLHRIRGVELLEP